MNLFTKPKTLLYAVLLVLLLIEITGHAYGTSPKEEWNIIQSSIEITQKPPAIKQGYFSK